MCYDMRWAGRLTRDALDAKAVTAANSEVRVVDRAGGSLFGGVITAHHGLASHIKAWNFMPCHAMPCHAMACHSTMARDVIYTVLGLPQVQRGVRGSQRVGEAIAARRSWRAGDARRGEL